MIKCRVKIVRGGSHTQQILSGFMRLAHAHVIHLKVDLLPWNASAWPFIVQAKIDDKVVAFDLQDGLFDPTISVNSEFLNGLDYFFVRSYKPGSYSRFEEKVFPLGLNYYVAADGILGVRAGSRSIMEILKKTSKRALGIDTSSKAKSFEQEPQTKSSGIVLFLTRLWSPAEGHQYSDSDLDSINQMRMACVRELQAEFGSSFIGGVRPTPWALKRCPDLVVDRKLTNKKAYLATVKRAAVCVTTRGLADSNSWKLAEYVVASKNIVCEPLSYVVPGDFLPGKNYLEFNDPSECVDAVTSLLDNSVASQSMRIANWRYYQQYLRPERVVGNAIDIVVARQQLESRLDNQS